METDKTLLVIGNGFDLSLGFKTSYKDFLKSDQFLKIINSNEFCKHLQVQLGLQNWIDIENELKIYSLKVINNDETNNKFEKEFVEVSNALMEYLATIDLKKYDVNSYAFKLIDEIKNKNVEVIDFNYTDSILSIFEDISLENPVFFKSENQQKIHGTLYEKNIIFGVEDKAQINSEHIFLKKSYNKTFGKYNPSVILNSATEIIFFGLSIGETDHMYFNNFFNTIAINQCNKKIRFYHYGNQDYKSLHKNLDILTYKSLSTFKNLNSIEFIDTSI